MIQTFSLSIDSLLSATQYGLGRIDMIEQAIVLSYDHLAISGPNRFPFIVF